MNHSQVGFTLVPGKTIVPHHVFDELMKSSVFTHEVKLVSIIFNTFFWGGVGIMHSWILKK